MTRAQEIADLLSGVTISTADNTAQLVLKSTDADASVGPVLNLSRDNSSAADNDLVGEVQFNADDDGNNQTTYGKILTVIEDASNGSEDGLMQIHTNVAGTLRDRIKITSSEVVLNEESIDSDFRVESDGNTHGLFLEGSTGELGIGTSTPSTFTDYVSGSNAPSVVVAGSQPSYILTDTDISGSTSTFGITKAGVNTNMNNLGAGDFAFTNNGAQRMVILSSGNVAIGTASAFSPGGVNSLLSVAGNLTVTKNQAAHTNIDIFNNTGDSAARGQLRVGYDASNCLEIFRVGNDANIILNATQNGSIVFQGAGSEMMRMSTAGLAIGGTGSANTLDDYEEGGWSPNIGGDATYSVQSATYTKIGRAVYVWFYIQINARNTSAQNLVYGLPFQPSTSNQYLGVVYHASMNVSVYEVHGNARSDSTIRFDGHTSSSGTQASGLNIFTDGTAVIGSGVYYT
jgi:hypothetical protein